MRVTGGTSFHAYLAGIESLTPLGMRGKGDTLLIELNCSKCCFVTSSTVSGIRIVLGSQRRVTMVHVIWSDCSKLPALLLLLLLLFLFFSSAATPPPIRVEWPSNWDYLGSSRPSILSRNPSLLDDLLYSFSYSVFKTDERDNSLTCKNS